MIGQQLVELGYPLDALRFYVDVIDEGLPQNAQQYGGANVEQQFRQLEQLLATTRSSIVSQKNLPGTLAAVLEPRPAAERKPRDAAINLLLQVSPRELNAIRMTSPIDDVLRAAAKGDQKQAAQDRVAGLVEKYPDDVSVQIVAALAALVDGEPAAIVDALARLDKLLQASPLEELPAGARANSRQRAEAARWLGLWLVARECLKLPDQRDVAVKLAERSLDAARRQNDPKYALSVLREWGQIDFQMEDKQGAEARWSEMAAIVLPPALKFEAGSRPFPVPTLAQFHQAADVAQLACLNNLNELSSRIVRDALKAGPPVNVTPAAGGFGPPAGAPGGAVRSTRVGSRQGQNSSSPNVVQVENKLSDLVRLWEKGALPLADQYETLAAVVFPEGRPSEIFLYPRSDAKDPASVPSIGKLLVTTAVKVGRVDDLLQHIASREKQPLAQPAALVLRSLLEVERPN
jgi:hypothetical protein